jgi:hypothetical protein
MNKCAPGKQFTEGSCFTVDNLQTIAKEYNDSHKDKIEINNNKKKLLRELTVRFEKKYGCDDQICWLKTDIVKGTKDADIKLNTFRPNGPAKQFEWLSTSDIEGVLKQYEFTHTDFKFLGAMPSDFDELPIYGTTDLQFDELENNTPKIGAVINLDTHDQSGSHWVAFYANLKTNTIYYFDSFAKTPQKRLKIFTRRLLTYMHNKKHNTKFSVDQFMKKYHDSNEYDVRYNKIQHQFKNSECGVYSMNFIIRLLEGDTFDYIVNNRVNDAEMNSFRKTYFRNANF